MEIKITEKAQKFNEVLQSAKKALDSINVDFHLHSGTALGAHRERSFIEHDNDIDLAVFYKDVNSVERLEELKTAMKKEGFEITNTLGKLDRGKEIQFEKNGVDLDIFWIYPGIYRGKEYFILSSYFGDCDKLRHKTCVYGYRPYAVKKVRFLGKIYSIVPKKTLIDMYGKTWKTPIKYDYFQGITEGHAKGLLKDYYDPRPTDQKIAFCFLLYNTVEHRKIWEKFFSGDNYPIPSYNIYSHLKKVTDETPNWILKNKIRTIKTGWCEENLVFAWINLLKEALKDPDNKYFAILSGSCIPLFTYEETYKKIFSSSKSRLNIDLTAEAYQATGLYYADQWVVLNRKHAELLVELKDTERGNEYLKKIRKQICIDDSCFCPDELYPVNWFIENYGKPHTKTFRKEFKDMQTTYTYWDGKKPHPIKFNNEKLKKFKEKICDSGAFFGRKFNEKAAKNIAMLCNKL